MTSAETNNPPARFPLALQVADLTIGFPRTRVPVVEGITFAVRSGQVLGLVGESGSGKTTLGLALLGHTRPGLAILDGSVTVDQTQIVGMDYEAVRRLRARVVSYVPQDPASGFNPALKLATQLRETLDAHPDGISPGENAETRVKEALTQVDLPVERVLRSYPHQLSGGQLQRVAIAMASLCRPSVIVLDEPTTGLDVSTQRRILEMLRDLTRQHQCAAIYISHDLPVVAEIADHVLVMYAGRVAEHGPAATVISSPSHPYTVGLLRAVPDIDRQAELTGIAGQPPRPGSWPDACAYADRCELVTDACRAGVPPLIERRGVQVRCIHSENVRLIPPGRALDLEPARQPAPSILQVSSLIASYGHTQILHDVAFDITAKRTLAVVGESGSGKTTLARCLSGLHPNWAGTVVFDGRPLAQTPGKRSESDRRLIQYIFQNPYNALNPKKTISEILEAALLEFFRLKQAERMRRIRDALSDVALNDRFLDRYPFQLSGGERQRVAIARALIVEPQLLICDEATSALDVSVQAAVVEQLRDLQAEHGLAMLFITHNLAVARSISQDMIVLNKGRIVERGSAATVLDSPRDPYTVGLLRDVPRLNDAVTRQAAGD